MSLNSLENQILAHIREKALFTPAGKALVAVSGGADSMALLHILVSLREALSLSLIAAHYDHGIRGEASRADAAFVIRACEELGVPCFLGEGDAAYAAAQARCSLEDAARRLRYAHFDAVAKAEGARWIALAHQREDQAETLLLHLIHGAGLSGLSGMRAVSGNRVRPLLDTPREALCGYLRARGIQWREDETNQDAFCTRNFLRHSVFPLLAKVNPRVAEAMGRTAHIIARAADREEALAREQLSGRVKRMPYGAFWALGEALPDAETARAFARWSGALPIDARMTEALTRREGCNLPGGWRAYFSKTRLHLLSPKWDRPALSEADFIIAPCERDAPCDGVRTQVFDAEKVHRAGFRQRREGDVFAPLGGPGTQKLKKTMQASGIDRPFRDLLPLLATDNRILWIVGARASQDAAVTGQTKSCVRMTYTGSLPWEIEAQ